MNTHDRIERKSGYVFILIFAIMAAGLVMAGDLYYRSYEREYRANVETQLSSIAESKVGELTLWRRERLGDGAVLLKNEAFSTLIRRYLEKPEDADAQRQLRAWLGKYHTAFHYSQVSLYDTLGIRRVSAPQTSEPVDSYITQNTAAILREGQVVLQDFHRDAPDSPIRLSVVVPILDEANGSRPLGVLAMDIDPTIYLYPFISKWPTPSQTGETLLVRRDGDDALFLNQIRFRKNTALNLRIPLTETERPAVKAALGQTGIFEGVQYRGEPVIVAINHVPDSPWYLAARMDTAEVYGPLRERLWLMVMFVGVLLIGSGAAMGFIWKRRNVRFYKERYEVAAELQRKTEELDRFFNTALDLLCIADTDGYFLRLNPEWEKTLGYTLDSLQGRHFLDFVHPDDLEATLQSVSRLSEQQSILNFINRYRHQDGTYRWIEWRSVPAGKLIFAAARDITERRLAEEELQRFFNLVPDMVCVASTDGHFLKINPVWEATLGYTEQEILSTPFLDFIHPDDKDATMKEVERQIGGEATILFTNRYRCKDGGYKWLEWMATPSPDKRLLFAAARDITERRLADINLRHAKEQAEAATKLKDQFVSLVAHDLRSPFISMLGLLRLFVERISRLANEDDKKILDLVFKNGDRMLTMIEELLKISRLQTGKITPQPRFFKGHNAVTIAIGSLSHNATQKGIEIINEVPPDMRLYADQSLFDEVLINLLSNAIKFCSSGDKITFFIPPGSKSAIAVRDSGRGIDKNNIPNLFRPEVTTTTPGTAGEMGTGLGLPYSHGIMKAHGGDITVESAPGEGSVFCAELPYVKPVALVVEDDELALAVLGEYLKRIGIDVIETFNGAQALTALKDNRPHIIITDIKMPKMDGFELLDRLKQDSATRDIPVIVMTGADGGARDNAFRHGADDFVGKPVGMDDLIPRVRRFVG